MMKTFDFDQWEELARLNPEAFEKISRLFINQAINKTSPCNRERIRGLQFRLDMERKKQRPALAHCIHFSQMMMDIFHNKFVPSLSSSCGTQKPAESENTVPAKADILTFPHS